MPSETERSSAVPQEVAPRFDHVPVVFVLPTHLGVDELEEVEQALLDRGGTLTYDIAEAKVVLGAIESTRRVKFELNTRNVHYDNVDPLETAVFVENDTSRLARTRKRVRSDVSLSPKPSRSQPNADETNWLSFVKLAWLHDSIAQRKTLELRDYLVCTVQTRSPAGIRKTTAIDTKAVGSGLVGYSTVDKAQHAHIEKSRRTQGSEYEGRTFRRSRKARSNIPDNLPRLRRENTSEHERSLQHPIPAAPAWVREAKAYACERITLADSPNNDFLDQLEKIRLARTLIDDQIGIRAYSTSIASLAAYPYKLSNPMEVERLPGCDQKIALLFQEYDTTGHVTASDAVDEDPALRVIRNFYNIWGVGAKTAREWYFERGWRDHDDIVEYGWNDLTRVQQIGLKFFDEFEMKIPRTEVEQIASIVEQHGKALTDQRMTCTLVGGYRRGKNESGDVDIILSHPEETVTHFFIHQLVIALEDSGWLTHTLTLSETNSQRDQQPLGLRVDSSKGGFDTLDKALLVWQDPIWAGRLESEEGGHASKNPNIHRRVDIIVSPWRTLGCAIAGWSSGTTFQRDLRRFAKHKHGWKFDSSGVRDRKTGRWIDLERWADPATRASTPLEAERRVFEGLGLEYREPRERCTR